MPRHRNDTEIFARLGFKGQALSMNAASVQFRKKIDANLRLAQAEGRNVNAVLRTRLALLQRIIDDYTRH